MDDVGFSDLIAPAAAYPTPASVPISDAPISYAAPPLPVPAPANPTVTPLPSVAAAHPGLQVIGDGVVPAGFEVWKDGVYALKGGRSANDPWPSVDQPLPQEIRAYRKEVALFPIWISNVGLTADDKHVLLQISFRDVIGALKQLWCSYSELVDHNALLRLGTQGLPVGTANVKTVSHYLNLAAALNGPTDRLMLIGNRCGPYDSHAGHGWLLGDTWIGPGAVMPHPNELGPYLNNYAAKGSLEAWCAQWREICAFDWDGGWLARAVTASGFAAPLIRLVGGRSFFIHHWTGSGQGKTALAFWRMSIYGDPEKLNSSLNMTQISGTEIFKHLTDYPILYDEKQVASVNLTQLIYAVVGQQTRGRSTKFGGVRGDKANWLTIAHTTGETPIVEANDLGGIQNRVIQLESAPFQHESQIAPIYGFCAEHHGVAGRAFLDRLQREVNAAGPDFIARKYKQARLDLAHLVGATPDTPHVKHAAIIAVAHRLSQYWLLGRQPDAAYDEGIRDAVRLLQESRSRAQPSYAIRALNFLRDHLFLARGSYMETLTAYGRSARDAGKMPYALVGIATETGISYIPAAIDKELKDQGFDPTRVWRDFDKEGWLVKTHAGATDYRTTYTVHEALSYSHPVYTIRPDVFFTDGGARASMTRVITEANGASMAEVKSPGLRLVGNGG